MKRRMTKRGPAVALALMSLSAFFLLPAGMANASTATVCAGRENVPDGFVKINDIWDPTTCGRPTSITYNLWVIESTQDKAVGEWISVCAGWRPTGWATVETDWNPNRCGHPSSISENIWIIQRLV
ncbi:hypothetical protein [Actinomadura rubrisoli]|uniref:Uncharacterized protein n=1 Tax=Actinomadura rubrisoli TaxID=2530368 RepID=A0A4R5BF56_9ACTN|nr:hypothetical protein [Actinomadura rubrisoli]TDD83476.1 hypothetical protein E1298_21240 [Actinomadura rubrisoli]